MNSPVGKGREVTAREIIQTIVDAMVSNLEPMYTKTLTPGLFQVYLREVDYVRLEGIFKDLQDEAGIALDERVTLLNKSVRRGFLPLLNKLYGLIKPRLDRIPEEVRPSLTGKVKLEGAIVKPRDGWQISFFRNEDTNSEPGDIEVVAILVLAARPELGAGLTTRSLRVLFRAGATVVKESPEDEVKPSPVDSAVPGPSSPVLVTVPSPDRKSARPQTADLLALIRYCDNDGEKVYEMTKTSIVIGRGGTGVWTDIKLNTLPDISREHLRIKRDETSGLFYLKDVSTLGTKIDGQTVPPSMKKVNGLEVDQDIWIRLPDRSSICLADVLTLEFDAS